MLPNPNLVSRLVEQHNHEVEARGRAQLGWPKPPATPPAAWRQWVLAAGALLLAGLSRVGRL
jgi:hypothetical protein